MGIIAQGDSHKPFQLQLTVYNNHNLIDVNILKFLFDFFFYSEFFN